MKRLALSTLLALAAFCTARGDLLDDVLNAPSPAEQPGAAETVEKPAMTETEGHNPADGGGTPVIRFNREGGNDNMSLSFLGGVQVAGDSLHGEKFSFDADQGFSAQLQFSRRLSERWKLDFRGLYLYERYSDDGSYQESYTSSYSYYSWYSGWHSVSYRSKRTVYWEALCKSKTLLCDASLCLTPWRGDGFFAPFAGIGARYARNEFEWEMHEWGGHSKWDEDDVEDSKTSLLLRIGVMSNIGRLAVKGEYLFTTDKDVGPKGELIGSLGLFATPQLQFFVFTDYFMWEKYKSCHVGGGVSFDF